MDESFFQGLGQPDGRQLERLPVWAATWIQSLKYDVIEAYHRRHGPKPDPIEILCDCQGAGCIKCEFDFRDVLPDQEAGSFASSGWEEEAPF